MDNSRGIRLNLGCGSDIREGWLNCDKYPLDDRVMFVDLEKLPLPWKDNTIECIFLKGVLEHLCMNPADLMLEIHRILKLGGVFEVFLPFLQPQVNHVRCFHPPSYFNVFIDKPWRKSRVSMEDTIKFKKVSFRLLFHRVTPFQFPWIMFDCHWVLRKI